MGLFISWVLPKRSYGNIVQLTKDISKPVGVLWFATALLFVIAMILFLMDNFTLVELCIVHQIRYAMRLIPDKGAKEFMQDLKAVYQAPNLQTAEDNLLILEEKRGKIYPKRWVLRPIIGLT